jgi:hypothetical protein
VSVVVTLRPTGDTGVPGAGPPWTLVGPGPTFAAMLSDNNDTTGMSAPDHDPPYNASGFVWIAHAGVPAGARVEWVRTWVHGARTTSGGTIRSFLSDQYVLYPIENLTPVSDGAEHYAPGAPRATNPNTGTDWNTGYPGYKELDDLRWQAEAGKFPGSGPDGAVAVSEVGVDVSYRRQGSVAVSAPTGAQATSFPTVQWVPSAPDNPSNPQAKYHVRVYSDAVYGQPGFDINNPSSPGYYAWEWASPVVADASARSLKIPKRLVQGPTYRAYVFVTQPWAGTASDWWSTTAYSEFTITLPPYATPTFSVVTEDDQGRARLRYGFGAGSDASYTSAGAYFQRSADGGATWGDVSPVYDQDGGGIWTPGYPLWPAGSTHDVYDYACPRNTEVLYACRIIADKPGVGEEVSAWNVQSCFMESTDWWLKAPSSPLLAARLRVANFSDEEHQASVAQEPLGTDDPVIQTDGRKASRGEVTFYCDDEDDWDALQALVDYNNAGNTLLLQGSLGRQWYLRFLSPRKNELGRAQPLDNERTGIRHWHKVTLSWIEKAGPPPAVH